MPIPPRALVDRLAAEVTDGHVAEVTDGHVAELAVGRRPAVAAALADRGFDVVATDLHEREVPDGVTFYRDDVTTPDRSIYAEADLLYALNLPAELQSPARHLAESVEAPLFFTTLGTEQPIVATVSEQLPDETLFWAIPDRD